jgi:hypothetical protein
VKLEESTPESVRVRVEKLSQELGNVISSAGSARLQQMWIDWQSRLRNISEESQRRSEVVTGFVGGTGAVLRKSTGSSPRQYGSRL